MRTSRQHADADRHVSHVATALRAVGAPNFCDASYLRVAPNFRDRTVPAERFDGRPKVELNSKDKENKENQGIIKWHGNWCDLPRCRS